MFFEFYRRELARTFRRPAFYVLLIPMAAMVYAFAANDDPSLTIMLHTGRTWRNSPVIVARLFASLSQFALLFSVLFTARAIASDFDHRIDTLLFATPMRKGPYLFGRFAAGFTACLIPFALVPVALALGSGRVPSEIAGPFRPSAAGLAFLVFLVPNAAFISAVLFALATWKRGMRLAYVAGVVMWGGFANARLDDVARWSHPELLALIDPTGVAALRCATRFWSIERQNAAMPWDGLILSNRLLWLAITGAILAFTWRSFRLVMLEARPSRVKVPPRHSDPPVIAMSHPASIPDPISQLLGLLRRETAELLLKPWMLLPLILGVAAVASNGAPGANDAVLYLTPARMAGIVTSSLQPYIIPLTIFFAGVVVWRERDRRMDPLIDSAPVQNWMVIVSKIAALVVLQVGMQVAGAMVGISRQWRWDRPLFDLMTYASVLGIDTIRNAQLAVVSVFLQTISKNKYAGFVATALIAAFPSVIERVEGFPRLLAFRSLPDHVHSDLMGYGPYAAGVAWYLVYWSLASAMMAIAAALLRRRGLRNVREGLREGLGLRSMRVALLAFVPAFVLTGLVLLVARVSRPPRTSEDGLVSMARYERRYRRLETMPVPSTKRVALDLTVERREVRLDGSYELLNETDGDIRDVYVTLAPPEGTEVRALTLTPAVRSVDVDAQTGMRHFRLARPWRRGARGELRFALRVTSRGIREDGLNDDVLDDAVLLSGSRGPRYFPVIGYEPRMTPRDDARRSRAGLPPARVAMPGERAAPMPDSRVIVETTIRTKAMVAAIAPGELVSRTESGGRIIHRYRTPAPIPLQASMVIACGSLTRTALTHRDLRIEMFFDRRHGANLQSMADGIKRAYDHCVRLYGPYRQGTIRVVEVPTRQLPEGTARAFAGVIAVREDGGFLTDLRDPARVDTVFSTLAHEMAHQWWPFQYPPTMSRGAEVLVETLPQWTRLVAMEQQWGREKTRRFLESELSAYLRGRAVASEREQPLSLARESYLVYRKGSIVLSALRARLGEAAIDRALASFAAEIARNPLAANTATLRGELMKVGTAEQRGWIAEQLDRIVLYELDAEIASSKHLPGDRTLIVVRLAASKFEIGMDGAEKRLPFHEPADLAIRDGKGNVIAIETIALTNGIRTISLAVRGRPVVAELDPWITRVTRKPRAAQ